MLTLSGALLSLSFIKITSTNTTFTTRYDKKFDVSCKINFIPLIYNLLNFKKAYKSFIQYTQIIFVHPQVGIVALNVIGDDVQSINDPVCLLI